MRTQKTDNSGTTYYYYDSGNNLIGMTKGNNTLLFYYDSDGNVTSFKYGGTMYYYIKNLQGDIVKIINQAGTVYASYVYDAWGNIKSVSGDTTLRELNPFRYRSYVYDSESGLYYLQSRYYDPFTGRFINADDTAYIDATDTTLSANLFAYCDNNSVNNIDIDGYKSKKKHFDIGSSIVSWGIDLIIMFMCPGASIAYDVVGFSIKKIFKKVGIKKSLDFLLKTAIPKCKGLFSKFFTTIRKLIWRATGLAINWLQNKAVNKFFDGISKLAKKFYKHADKAILLITGLFSFGSFVATVLDIASDNNLNGKIRIW